MGTKTMIGPAVRGDDFYLRPKIIKDIYGYLERGNNILLSAPRRIGKTSIMFYLLDNPEANYLVRYIITQSISNENDYYKRLYKNVIEVVKGVKSLWEQTKTLVSSKRITGITAEGITIDSVDLNYHDELILLLKSLNLGSQRLVIMIDEFSETLENIIADEGAQQAVLFLESNRDLRLIPELYKKVQFIYTGSIGLENIVGRLNKMNTINDLYPFKVNPFLEKETKNLIDNLIEGSDLIISDEQKDLIISEIEWLIPFFIQIVIDEIDKIEWETDELGMRVVTNQIITDAISNSLRNRTYFEHWQSRLRIAYKGNEYRYAMELLNRISTETIIHFNDITNLAVKHELQDDYRDILNALVHDGYINNLMEKKEFRFNSPLLKKWWFENVAI